MRKNRTTGTTGVIETQFILDKIILNIAKQRKQIIYGARSIQKQAGLLSRNTKDYDIFDKHPKASADLLQKILDKIAGYDYYYVKPAKHQGTWKVKGRGNDGLRNTEDDESIADYSKPTEKVKFVIRNGVRYRILKKELERKIAVSKDPEYAFRKEKDRDDIRRIKAFIKIKNIVGGNIG